MARAVRQFGEDCNLLKFNRVRLGVRLTSSPNCQKQSALNLQNCLNFVVKYLRRNYCPLSDLQLTRRFECFDYLICLRWMETVVVWVVTWLPFGRQASDSMFRSGGESSIVWADLIVNSISAILIFYRRNELGGRVVQQKPDGTAHELGSSGQSDRSRSPVPIVNSDSTRSTWPVQRCHIQPDSHWCRYPHDKAIRSTLGNTANVKTCPEE